MPLSPLFFQNTKIFKRKYFLQTADENYAALQDFFNNVFPEYMNRSFYVTGESYGGIYLPMLTERIINGIQNGTFVINFKVFVIINIEIRSRVPQSEME